MILDSSNVVSWSLYGNTLHSKLNDVCCLGSRRQCCETAESGRAAERAALAVAQNLEAYQVKHGRATFLPYGAAQTQGADLWHEESQAICLVPLLAT